MKLAVSYENGQVSPHFGQSKQFQFYDVADGVATPGQVLDVPGAGHAAVTAFLAQQGAQAVISGFVGGGARQALEQAGIAPLPQRHRCGAGAGPAAGPGDAGVRRGGAGGRRRLRRA